MSRTRENIEVKLAVLRDKKILVEQAIRSLETVQKMRGATKRGK
jgi:hypothetical protein